MAMVRIAGVLGMAVPLAALAQAPSSQPETVRPAATPAATPNERLGSLRVFAPDFYAQYRPKTALDIVLRTPGFQLALGTSGRGLDGTAGNVLINGVRPPAKAAPVTTVLAAIPAEEVKSVLLVPAGSLDVDMAGHPLLLYLVTVPKAGIERSVTASATSRGRLGQTRSVEADVRLSRPRQLFSGNVQDTRSRTVSQGGLAGPLVGQTSARRSGGAQSDLASTSLSTMAQWRLDAGRNVQLRLNVRQSDSDGRPLPADDAPVELETASSALARGGDLAAEVQWPFAGGRGDLALTGLVSRNDSESMAWVRTSQGESDSASRSRSGESAMRVSLRWKLSDAWRLLAGADHAANYQAGDFRYRVGGVEVDVPGSASDVGEARSGVFAAATWTPDPQWMAEAGLRWEWSELRSAGEASVADRFSDLLPRVSATWTPASAIRVQAHAERTVGQLAFSQFLASVGLTDEVITAGARALEPERSWRYGLDYEHRFGERGLLSVGVERQRVDNPIDAVVLDDGLQVTANVAPATIYALTLQLAAPLDRVGMPGGLLSISKREAWSRTIDPVTGEPREVSSVPESASLSLRQDLSDKRGAWGLSLTGASDSTYYGVAQVTRMRTSAGGSLFGEWRPRESLALRLTYSRGGKSESELWLYGGPRSIGLPADLRYLATTWVQPTWQAKLEWIPNPKARFEFGAATASDSRMVGRTLSSEGENVERLTLSAQPMLSAQMQLRW